MNIDQPLLNQLPETQQKQVMPAFYAVIGRAEISPALYPVEQLTAREYSETIAAALLWTVRALTDSGQVTTSSLACVLDDPDRLAGWDCPPRERLQAARALTQAASVSTVDEVARIVDLAGKYLARSEDSYPLVASLRGASVAFDSLLASPENRRMLCVACTKAVARHALGMYARGFLADTPDLFATGSATDAEMRTRNEAVAVMAWALAWGVSKNEIMRLFGITRPGLNKMLARAGAE